MLRQGIRLRPGARELVTYLTEEGVPQAIATSSRRPTVDRYLGHVGLLEHFAANHHAGAGDPIGLYGLIDHWWSDNPFG